EVTRGVPAVVEIFEQRRITPADEFRMMPGFRNFQSVQKGEHLATDRNGPIKADRPCRVMLPLYQEQGEDGYFLARDVRPLWLAVASLLRRLRLDAIAHWFPGVRRSASDRNTLLVNSRIARWFVTEVFHLLGFRRVRRHGKVLAFTRRWSLKENRQLYVRGGGAGR
ncbi:MAG: hypothetical protein VYE77_00345, partial [Planctomycetota bacterium]|nr:hypothetical protein [Planctomycetota bacterium]